MLILLYKHVQVGIATSYETRGKEQVKRSLRGGRDGDIDMKTLDVGCGGAKHEGAVGIDWTPGPGVDVAHDLNKVPWPFEDNTFDLIICQDTIQILDSVVATMDEMHRVGKNGARVKIRTPHFAHPNSFRDPLHKWHLTFDTFDYFTVDFDYPIYTQRKYKIIERELIFKRRWGMGYLLSRLSVRRYEKYHSHRYPPYGMNFELEIVK